MKISIINGPNLNLTGQREPSIYGTENFQDLLGRLKQKHGSVEFDYFQSNVEGELINHIHSSANRCIGVVLNPGGYTHTSVALADAVASIETPVIEVHLSNIFSRESFRHVSYVGAKCIGCISGLGLKGYELAVSYLIESESATRR